MPVPLIIAIPAFAAAGLGIYGAKKACDAVRDTKEARSIDAEARRTLQRGEKPLRKARKRCRKKLKKLGRLKLEVWDRQLGRFVSLYGQLRDVELTGAPRSDRLGKRTFSKAELADMTEMSNLAGKVVRGGATALGTGALLGVAGYGGAAMFGSASTGTAIATLQGVAATNATLAWLGGGSLAAGGAGIVGGAAVLGGIVAAPVLAVGGLLWSAEARKKLAAARCNLALAEEYAAEMQDAALVVNAIRKLAAQHRDLIIRLDKRMKPVLDDLAAVIRRSGSDYSKYTKADRRKVHLAVAFAQGLEIVLNAPLLTEDGRPDEKRARKALAHGRRLLGAWRFLPSKREILHMIKRLSSFFGRHPRRFIRP